MRPRTTFAMVGIPVGSTLVLDIDQTAQVVTIDNKNMVRLPSGKNMPLSRAADELMRERGRAWKGVSGPERFKYNGESIWEIRLRMEREGLI